MIGIDAMGSDDCPASEVKGVADFLKENSDAEVRFILFGDEKIIKQEIANHSLDLNKVEIVHTSQVVTMDDGAKAAIKSKKDSSMARGLSFHKEGKIDAFISAGNTGAMLATATILLGRIKGVSRPTVATPFPTEGEFPVLILDAGANVDCKPQFLYEFAVMGTLFMKETFGIDDPKVALLNVGEEPGKGNEQAVATYKLLSKSNAINFYGNYEGRDIFSGKASVVVCDGFTGNIVLKFAESIFGFLKSQLRKYADVSLTNKIKIGLFAPTLKDALSGLDYQKYGGVPMLGVKGVVMIGHGSSKPQAINAMIVRSLGIIERKLNKKIENALQENK